MKSSVNSDEHELKIRKAQDRIAEIDATIDNLHKMHKAKLKEYAINSALFQDSNATKADMIADNYDIYKDSIADLEIEKNALRDEIKNEENIRRQELIEADKKAREEKLNEANQKAKAAEAKDILSHLETSTGTYSIDGMTDEEILDTYNSIKASPSMTERLEKAKEAAKNDKQIAKSQANEFIEPVQEAMNEAGVTRQQAIKEVENPEIEIVDVSKTALEILKNNTEYGLKDYFSGELLKGKIKVASHIGDLGEPVGDLSSGMTLRPRYWYKSQDDAVGSAVKSENCFINIVADGVGGSHRGQDASKYLTDSLINWFNSLSDEQLSDTILLSDLLESEIKRINNELYNNYYGSALTTVVLALTVGDKTIIANIGDSTAYAYDENNDSLKMLSTLDSYSRGLSYEDARHNPDNNVITAAVGDRKDHKLHINVIDNCGQKIILSSDGVTDLVSEDRFKSYFKSDVDPKDIINDAFSKVDIDDPRMKSEDNISAIVVNLPGSELNKGRGTR